MMVPITGVEFDCACAGATKNKRQNAAREIPLIIVLFPFGRWLPTSLWLCWVQTPPLRVKTQTAPSPELLPSLNAVSSSL
jgi:hypothetical protein